jgi:hypothetical protein
MKYYLWVGDAATRRTLRDRLNGTSGPFIIKWPYDDLGALHFWKELTNVEFLSEIGKKTPVYVLTGKEWKKEFRLEVKT